MKLQFTLTLFSAWTFDICNPNWSSNKQTLLLLLLKKRIKLISNHNKHILNMKNLITKLLILCTPYFGNYRLLFIGFQVFCDGVVFVQIRGDYSTTTSQFFIFSKQKYKSFLHFRCVDCDNKWVFASNIWASAQFYYGINRPHFNEMPLISSNRCRCFPNPFQSARTRALVSLAFLSNLLASVYSRACV